MTVTMYGYLKAAITMMLLTAIAVAISACSLVSGAATSKEYQAEVTTGVNRLYGEPLLEFDFMPSTFRERFGFETIGVFNPTGPDPTLLNSATPDTAVLASLVDANGVGLPPAILNNPANQMLVNVPLREIATWVLPPTLLMRSSLLPHLDGLVVGPTQAEPAGPITRGTGLRPREYDSKV